MIAKYSIDIDAKSITLLCIQVHFCPSYFLPLDPQMLGICLVLAIQYKYVYSQPNFPNNNNYDE